MCMQCDIRGSNNSLQPLETLHTEATTPIGLRMLDWDNIVHAMVMQLLYILEKANLPLNATVCLLTFKFPKIIVHRLRQLSHPC